MSEFLIAIASGKGGTGKTTVAAALALALSKRFAEAQFIDCDVEAPDAAYFLKPTIENSTPVEVQLPVVDREKCTGCGECQAACQYNAIRVVSGKAELLAESCIACGGCKLVCPADAITEKAQRIGVVESGETENLIFHRGRLDPGFPLSTPLIRGLKAIARADVTTVIDCGSGTASDVIAAIRGSDYCILVAEPTPFGLQSLRQILGVVNEIGVPAGIIVNKDEASGSGIDAYASEAGVPILMRIPFNKEIASLGSKGVPLTETDTSWDQTFWEMYENLVRAIWKSRSR
jgi:MinD superfamily P-loop ATPase